MNHDPTAPTSHPGGDSGAAHTYMTPALRERLDSVSKTAHIELVRASENKAGLLLSWGGVAYGVLVTLILTGPARFPGIGRFGVILALLMLSMAVMLILITVRPRIPKDGGPRIITYAKAPTPQALIDLMHAEAAEAGRYELSLANDALLACQIAVIKHRNLRWAVDLIVVSIVTLTVTVFLERLI
ncbi:Pycsar system effector family protein [Streptosporangium roseum]|uniref:Pycsar system effector family protein n=1 Tax=Streptosporangium roseum TaxID=2001 RepID=UPI0033187A6D